VENKGVLMLVFIPVSTLILSWAILLPMAKKCEIRLRISLVGSSVIGIVAGAILMLTGIRPANTVSLIGMEVGFIIGITGLIGLYLFYRDPERIPSDLDNVIIAPADGFIRYVKQVSKGTIPVSTKGKTQIPMRDFTGADMLGNGGWLIGTVMTYIDVHVNRIPIDGKIVLVKHIRGKFLSLKHETALAVSERASMIIDNDKFKIGLILIASRMVRRIVLWVKNGDTVKRGQRAGKIVFGSQTDILIPALQGLKIEVREGQQVYAGLTVIASFK
jgi:phosphatidylserine decarboxylase